MGAFLNYMDIFSGSDWFSRAGSDGPKQKKLPQFDLVSHVLHVHTEKVKQDYLLSNCN